MKRSIVFFITVFFAILFLEGVALAAAPIQITGHPANQGRPDVHGNIVVWKDLRNGNWDIYMYDLAFGAEWAISTHPAYQNVPVTNGSIILWQDDRAGATNNDIYYTAIGGGQETLLVSGPGNQGQPAVSGQTVAYVDDRSGNNDIYAIDVPTGAVTPVSVNSASQWQPRIDGSRIVWEDNRNGNWDIYVYDLATGIEEAVSTDPADEKVADISGDRVVWQRSGSGATDIWMKDLGTGVVEPVTADTAYQNSPRISGDIVVWEHYDYQGTNWDVYSKDLTSGAISMVVGGSGVEARPAIDREYVVWEAQAGSGYDIWMARLADSVAPSITSVAPTGGSDTGCATPQISAGFSDNRVGIDIETVSLQVDGEDVTGGANITESGISYTPPEPFAQGVHTVSLSLSDRAGNTGSSSWSFTHQNPPSLSIAVTDRYWASFDDYISRDLSVSFNIANVSNAFTSDAEVVTAVATGGVGLSSQTPVAVGSISPAGSSDALLRYSIPSGVGNFKTTVYVGYRDSCGGPYISPGPPPNV